MMRVDLVTTFPNILDSYINESMMKQAQKKNLLNFHAHNLRDWTHDPHKTTDDCIFGGASGLIMKCEPIFECIESVVGKDFVESKIEAYKNGVEFHQDNLRVIIPCPQGKVFCDKHAFELSKIERLVFICGHYEGIDERAYCLADDLFSIGDFVLTSGELSSLVMIDSIVRKIPGVLGADDGAVNESFANSLLEHPQFTRPADYRGLDVPEVLRRGNNEKIEQFNRFESLKRTWKLRPDLIEEAMKSGNLTHDDLEMIASIKKDSL